MPIAISIATKCLDLEFNFTVALWRHGAAATQPVDSKILFSLIFGLNVNVSIYFFFTTMDYINTVHA